MTCREFHSRLTGVAKLLKQASLQSGDRVLLLVGPSVDMFCIAIAILAMGMWRCQ